MDKRASIEGSILLYIILLVIVIVIIIIFLQFFTPFKFSSFIEAFFSSGTSINGGKLQ
ncbi:hypothetical protein M1316_02690 [Candidatus Parvarchaeota archaeon]|nr:hypothetical protein [Candidatus Parvarchaeota archaeon]